MRALAIMAAVLAAIEAAGAAPTIDVGVLVLEPDTPGQQIALRVFGGDAVTGFNLRAQMGDGLGPLAEPAFQSVGFSESIWAGRPQMVVGGPVTGAVQFAQASVVLSTFGDSVPACGILVRLTIDTTGLTMPGEYPLLLTATQIGADSDFILSGGDSLAPVVANGTIKVVPLADRLPGDADLDGSVRRADLLALKSWFGQPWVGWSGGDFNLDGGSDVLDYIILKANYGRTEGGQVPEPATAALLALAALGLVPRRSLRSPLFRVPRILLP